MKALLRSGSLLVLVFLLTACPYESPVPITPATEPIDASLLGDWFKQDEMESQYPTEYYRIKQKSPLLYDVIKNDLNNEDSTYRQEIFISHLSVLKSQDGTVFRFLNMKKDGNFYLHRIDLSKDQFTLYEVTDNIDERFEKSSDLAAFVKQNMQLSFFYNKDEVTFFRGNTKGK